MTSQDASREPTGHLMARCPACSAQLAYVPGTASMRCGSCGTEVTFTQGAASTGTGQAYDSWATQDAARVGGTSVTMRCEGCGAVTENDSMSTTCQFCASHLVALTGAPGMVVPDAVLPFAVTPAAAREKFRAWINHQFFGVKALKNINAEESLVGTYLPYWSVSATTESYFEGQRGVDHEEERSNGAKEIVTHWYPRSGSVPGRYEDTIVPGKEVDINLAVAVGGLTMKDFVAYRPEYLAGFSTARYDIDPANAVENAKSKIANQIRGRVNSAIGGDHQKIENIQTAYSDVSFRLVLVPVWMATFVFGGKRWPILISGRTGSVYGKVPVNRFKMFVTTAAMFAVVVGGVLLAMKLFS